MQEKEKLQLKEKVERWIKMENIKPSEKQNYLFDLLDNDIIDNEEYKYLKEVI